MHKDTIDFNSKSFGFRNNRNKRLKPWMIVIALLLLILPTVLCFILYNKVITLQKQIDMLMIDRYGATYSEMYAQHNDGIALAAVSDNNTKNNGKTNNPRMNNEGTDSKNNNDANQQYKSDHNKIVQNQNSSTAQNGLQQNIDSTSTSMENEQKEKTVYLTFDDGPSIYTDRILDILSEYGVKATFFVIGKTDEHSLAMYKRIVKEGHTLGMHSYSHEYNNIYKSVEDFDRDFTKLSDLLYDTTGYHPTIYRFPGGSSNQLSDLGITNFIDYLNRKSITYFDWNVENGDATGEELTTNELYTNVMDGIALHNTSIVLMHDTNKKINTVNSLSLILHTLNKDGVKVLPLNETVTPIQQIKVVAPNN